MLTNLSNFKKGSTVLSIFSVFLSGFRFGQSMKTKPDNRRRLSSFNNTYTLEIEEKQLKCQNEHFILCFFLSKFEGSHIFELI